ncbi:MAG: hypothetical protein WC979_02620 [Candidatus Pacearchaeota archaeon]|nr:hypothetical protein [Clostridia bacterium]
MITFNNNTYNLPKYPEEIQDYLRSFVPTLKAVLIDDAASRNEMVTDAPDEVYEAAITSVYGEKTLKNFIEDGTICLYLTEPTEEELLLEIQNCASTVFLYNLKRKGLLDSIDDEDGVEVFFIKNKKAIKDIIDNK